MLLPKKKILISQAAVGKFSAPYWLKQERIMIGFFGTWIPHYNQIRLYQNLDYLTPEKVYFGKKN